MKKLYFFVGFLLCINTAFSQVLTENFSYTAGQLLTANGWTAHSGGGTNAITVVSPGLSYPSHPGSGVGNAVSMTTSGEDDNKTFAAVTTGSVYMSFLINVSASQTTGDYFIGLFQTSSIFPLRIYAKSDGAGGFYFGVSKANGTPAYETNPRVFGTTYFVAANYIFNTGTTTDDVVNLWVNPVLGATETTATIPGVTGTVTDGSSIGAVYLRQGSASNASTQQIDAILVGTTWADVTQAGAATPSLSATTLTAFNNVCINTESGPNSFTITGSNLTTADVTVAALLGFTYSTTAGGTYTSSLTLTQTGGAFSQQVFVKFTPTAVQSYNGNIAVGGGGATSINVAASGAGINTIPSVSSGAASSVTQSSATVAGTITANGCSAITAYGIEYSTTVGFPNGTGTAVPSSNLSGGNFSSDLVGLAQGTTYYYHAYATNGGGTGYGTEQSFTTTTPNPAISTTALTVFGDICINTTAGPNSFTINGTNLTTADVTVAALTGFTYSTTAGGTYTTTLTLTQPGGTYTQEVFVKFDPAAVQSYNGNIVVNGGGIAAPVNVAASGAGINSTPTVTSGSASAITTSSATVAGTITANGCSGVSAYGIEYSSTAGFPNGTGTAVASTNITGGNFSSDLSGLTASTIYYYHAYATNGAGTGYGAEQSFTTSSPIPTGGVVISQVYGGGGNTSATYNQDFVELFNRTTNPVDISGWSIQYSSATGTAWAVTTIPASTIVAPGKYYLIGLATGANGVALPTPDLTNTTNMSGTAGKVALVSNNTALSGSAACSSPTVMDVLGYGSTASCSETAIFSTTGITTAQSMFRKTNGCTETNDNSADFEILTVAPRNSATAANICGVPVPSLTATALTAFANVCINTTAGPNSFTISGTDLTAADVTVAALPGFTYSTTAGGTYTSSLTLTQPGGSFSQQVFVNFTPTAVQSYNGNIVVGGGGATSIDVAASGAGVNTIPSLTTGAASAITLNSATAAGAITDNGCSAVTVYGIEYSTTAGFPNGTGAAVSSTNLAGGNFSADLTGLASGTTYYYHAYATNAGGTGYGTEQSFTTLTPAPTMTTTALTAFGNVCINTTAGPNSFTINGSNLTTADVTVGPLTGFTFSTTAGGVYTNSLTLTQPGGAYTQQIFVRFTPTAVQSYNGNIIGNGGGIAAPVNVPASGAGVNTAATVTTGAASAITTSAATVAGTITATGCSAVTAYGIEYSTTNGFPNGTGTPVASTNLAGGNFSSSLTGLAPATTYYYHAYATNSGGTSYGAQQSFTTATPVLTVTALTGFGSVCTNTTVGPNSFIISSTGLAAGNISVGALAGYTYSTTAGGTYTNTLTITQAGGPFNQTVYVKFTPTVVQSYNGNIVVNGGGATAVNVAVTGAGVSTTPTVVTGAATAITTNSVVLAGTTTANGCTPLTELGFEYSGINNFTPGNGTKVLADNGIFTAQVTGLVQGATYYYRAYAKNGGGTAYGEQQSFTVASIPDEFVVYPVPVERGQELKFSMNNLTPGYHGLLFYNSAGALVYQKNLNIQADFINQSLIIPGTLPRGTYRIQLVNYKKVLATKSIVIQ
jgi:hypothetical protein